MRLTTHETNPSHTITMGPLPRNKKEVNRLFWIWISRAIQKAATTLSAASLTVLVVRLLYLFFKIQVKAETSFFF